MAYDIFKMKNVAKQMNNLTYTDYYYRLVMIARSIYKWNNLPNGMNEKWIEQYLFSEGNAVFFNDPIRGYMVAKCTDAGTLNYYDEPTHVKPYGTNFMGKTLEVGEECVIIRNNDLMIPTSPTLQLYAYRLAEISRTIDVNISAQKTPVMLLSTDKQKLSLKRMFDQVQDNEIAIYGHKDIDTTEVKAIKIDAPIVFDKLQIQKHAIWNECMTFLGINNANMDKRERLVNDEVQANNEQVDISAEVMLKAREKACEEINKMFGLDISVEKRTKKEIESKLKGGNEE